MSGLENTSQTPSDTQRATDVSQGTNAAVGDADATADILIRQMMVAQKREVSREVLPELVPGADEADAEPIKHPRKLFQKARTTDKPKAQSKPEAKMGPAKFKRNLKNAVAYVGSYRPSRKFAFFALIAAVVYVRPWLIPITLFVAFWVVLIGYLTLGPDRVAELVVGAWQKLHARRPELAENIRHRAQAMAERIDAVLDRMPGSWSDQIHVPDFSPNQNIAADRPDPFDRLAKEAQRG